MQIQELQNDQTVKARWGREGKTGPQWGDWQSVDLYIQRNKQGQVVTIALQGVSWAEYSPDNYDPYYKVFESEGFYLQIKDQ